MAKIRDNYGFVVNPGQEDITADPGPRPRRKLALLAIPLAIQAAIALYVTRVLAEPWRYAMFVVVPAITIFLFMSRLRMFLEHGSLDYEQFDYLQNPRLTARTIPSRFPENVVLCGMNFNYHYEHHLFPAVPSCQLRRVHEKVTGATIPSADFSETYLSALGGLWRRLGRPGTRVV